MSFQDTFCTSPWIHMHITNQGEYSFCRGAGVVDGLMGVNIRDVDPIDFFQNHMSKVRKSLIDGEAYTHCKHCYLQDTHNKVSLRKKQLLKTGVIEQNFYKSLRSSPWYKEINHSASNNGHTSVLPVDWQIDLGNTCNSACVFCLPKYSSRLALELKKLGFIEQVPQTTWCDDPELLDKLIHTLKSTPNLRYLHFLGGETIITPAFKTMLKKLVASGNTSATIGFTTNLTVWDEEIIQLLQNFGGVNVGLSIETLHCVNDYLRYPLNTTQAKKLLDQWVHVSKQNNWLASIRTTPSVFSVLHVIDMYNYALSNNTSLESCNFMSEPSFMRPSVLPKEYRDQAIQKLQTWVDTNSIEGKERVVNIRNPNTVQELLSQDVQSYINYLKNQPDESHLLPQLVNYIKRLEQNRNNSILDYLPEYENFLRSAGY